MTDEPMTQSVEEAPVPQEEGTGVASAAPEGTEPEAASSEGVDELRTALAEAERLRDDYLDQAQRSRAEFQNLRRRNDEAMGSALDRGAERLITQLLGVLDNFSYVVDAANEDEETQLAKGLRMVHSELLAALEAAGLEPIPGVGSVFDPKVHDALLSEESAEPLEDPMVTEVLRTGYRFKGRTLRPASVKVAR